MDSMHGHHLFSHRMQGQSIAAVDQRVAEFLHANWNRAIDFMHGLRHVFACNVHVDELGA
jgi:hypothetical protein